MIHGFGNAGLLGTVSSADWQDITKPYFDSAKIFQDVSQGCDGSMDNLTKNEVTLNGTFTKAYLQKIMQVMGS